MAKLVLNDIDSLANTASAKQALNENFTAIEAAMEKTLSRDGTLPNQMQADIDMDGNDILNANRVDAVEYFKNGVPFEQTVAYANKLFDLFSGTGAQTEFTMQTDPGSLGNLYVSVDGADLKPGVDYNYNGTTLTFVVAPVAGTNNIYVRYDRALATEDSVLRQDLASNASGKGASLISYTGPTSGAVEGTVVSRLQETVSIFDFCTPQQKADIKARTRLIDVSDAFTAAIASGKRILCPAGDYLIGKTVGTTPRSLGYQIEGEGPQHTVFVINGAGAAGVSAGFVASGQSTLFKGIKFTPIGAKPLRAVHIDNTTAYSLGDLIEDCWFYAAAAALNFQTCLEMTNNWYWAVRNCVFQNGEINVDFDGIHIALRACVAGVIDSCHFFSAGTCLFFTPDVISGHMNEGMAITNNNIAPVNNVLFAPPNSVAHPSTTYAVTISHNVIDPIQSSIVTGLINSLRIVNNHLGIVNDAGELLDLDAGSFGLVLAQNRVVAPSTSVATGITVREQGAIISDNSLSGFNIIADLTNSSKAIVTGNVLELSVGTPVIMGAGGVYEGNQEISCGAAPTLGDAARCGVYTPTLTNSTNISASTAYPTHWMRVKQGAYDVVTVSGKVDIDPTSATTDTQLQISLPVASNLAALQDLAGTAVLDDGTENRSARIYAGSGSDVANMLFRTDALITNQAWFFTFTYRVL